jgi:phosphodiesterase/alkaline phosphatase D-like protein
MTIGNKAAVPCLILFAALVALMALMGPVGVARADTVTFTADELLGKPTNNSITINVVPASNIQYIYKYGTTSGNLTQQTSPVSATGGQPSELTITGLNPDTKYYYQMVYDADGSVTDGDSETKTEHSFHTARAAGSTFSFAVTSDGHAANTQNAFTRILNELPDFGLDLGDTFMLDNATSQSAVNNAYLAVRASNHMGIAGVSVPIFSTPGNHEQEEGWNLDEASGIGSIQARKAFFPTPSPVDGPFYSANSDPLAAIDEATYGNEYREDYFSWTWGDALFIVIDTFEYTAQNPYGNVAGEGSNDPQGGDQWNWTLGQTQYNWLKSTLEGSTAKYKFVFSHQMVGGMLHADVNVGYVRGGAEAAPYFEWGGYTSNNAGAFDFATKRPGMSKTIRQMFIDNGVTAYFHGHDHQYVYETRDNMSYVEVPSCGSMSAFNLYSVGSHSDVAGDYQTLTQSGSQGSHIRVTVAPNQATLELISGSGAVSDTRTMQPYNPGSTHQLTMAAGTGSGATTPSVGAHSYADGAVVDITATPAVGYIFSNWTGGVTGTTNPTTVTMDGDKTVTANFTAQNYDLTMAVSPAGGGTTSPAVGTASHGANAVVNITATPASGYMFTGWSGTGIADPTAASTTVTVNAVKTVTANFSTVPEGTVIVDGSVSESTADDVAGISFSHTTGTGQNRLLVVGVSWNSGSDVRSISSLTFTPTAGSAQNLTKAVGRTHSTQNRDSALYYLVNPGSGVSGTVAINFTPGSVANGIVAGAINLAGVDQTTPVGVTGSADSVASQNTAPTVTLTGLSGNELVIDNLFMGGTSTSQTITAGSGQTQRWNDFTGNTRAGGSTEQAASTSVTMSWTAASNGYWDIVAAAVRPATNGSTYTINLSEGWNLLAATPGTTGFPSSLFGWTGTAYQSVADPVSWDGYWCKATATGTVTVTPTTGPKTIDLGIGWNLIGNSMGSVATLTLPSGRSAFIYDAASKSYVSVTSLQPGQGAWVKGVNSGETAVLTGS